MPESDESDISAIFKVNILVFDLSFKISDA
jgi:hypothetical protein